ncbi:mediator of RNA polymerase II transcription subunit 15-like [Macrobrachium rosenbergii]|uniref:mediator of RNA polymerase II transcription subunit 15-like n=1 Tax=Macrobrachium rosenbergii TaxID=79674 RepID=UPI0034D44104
MSHRTNRPHSWCPRGESPLRLPDGGSASSPVASPGIQGLPPAIASPRSTPTPFKLRRLSFGGERSGSPLATPAGGVALPHLQLMQQQQQQEQQQALHHAVTMAAQNQQFQQYHAEEQVLHDICEETASMQQVTVQQNSTMAMTQQHSVQQSGVFYPMPQHPAPAGPVQQVKNMEPRSPPSSRPASAILREQEIWSPYPTSRPPSGLMKDRDPRSPTPVKPSPLVQGERDVSSPTPTRPFPFRPKERGSIALQPRSNPLSQRQREPWSPSRMSPLAQRERDPMSPTPARPSPLAQKERDPLSPTPPKPSPLVIQKDRDTYSPTPSRLFTHRSLGEVSLYASVFKSALPVCLSLWSEIPVCLSLQVSLQAGSLCISQYLSETSLDAAISEGQQSPKSPLSSRPSSLIRMAAGSPLSMMGFPGPETDYQPSSQELIDRQSQDFVDERLAEFQAQIHQLQGKVFTVAVL